MIQVTVSGHRVELTADDVRHRLRDTRPEPVQQYSVQVGSRVYPVKQAFEAAIGIPRSAFTSQAARRHLTALGFEVVPGRVGGRPQSSPSLLTQPNVRGAAGTAGQSASAGDWHTEAKVQAMVVTVASGIRCKSTGAVPASGVRLGGRSDSFGLIVGLGCCDSAWPQLAGRFEQRAAQVLEQPQPVTGHGEAAPAG
jgi:hypothetical protein